MPFLADSSLLFVTTLNVVIIILSVLFLSIEVLSSSLSLIKSATTIRSLIISLGLISLLFAFGILFVLTFLSSKSILTASLFSIV